mmetsp:Transcript_3590/g.8957  ORF Transcript_3590/g.8957 Transcript_3590/m.8957 type:complete len:316 (-) Transcript_3590:529-1476(-)
MQFFPPRALLLGSLAFLHCDRDGLRGHVVEALLEPPLPAVVAPSALHLNPARGVHQLEFLVPGGPRLVTGIQYGSRLACTSVDAVTCRDVLHLLGLNKLSPALVRAALANGQFVPAVVDEAAPVVGVAQQKSAILVQLVSSKALARLRHTSLHSKSPFLVLPVFRRQRLGVHAQIAVALLPDQVAILDVPDLVVVLHRLLVARIHQDRRSTRRVQAIICLTYSDLKPVQHPLGVQNLARVLSVTPLETQLEARDCIRAVRAHTQGASAAAATVLYDQGASQPEVCWRNLPAARSHRFGAFGLDGRGAMAVRRHEL